MQRTLLILFFVFHFTIAFSQDTTNTYSLHQYTTENGLPSNLVRGIQWDNSTNFLWIVTEGGIVRFNGVEFKSYNKEKISPIVPQKNVYAVKNIPAIFLFRMEAAIFMLYSKTNLFYQSHLLLVILLSITILYPFRMPFLMLK
ncbi:MAG: hypothetical protein WDM90_10100 [Ferruginibacter sp.]